MRRHFSPPVHAGGLSLEASFISMALEVPL
jgi:hypothetical protein